MENVMRMCNKKLVITLTLSLTVALTGCLDSSDKLDDKLTHEVEISFVNSLSYMADFYAQKRSISTGGSGLFDSDNLVSGDVPKNEVASIYNYSYKVTNNMLDLGVKDSVNANKEDRITSILSKDDNLWVIAWEYSGDRDISVVKKSQNNISDVFNVRLFANGSYDVAVAGSQVLTTEKGKVTDYLSVSSCADGLKVANNNIDLCAGNFGASYLLVVDNNGKLVMAQE
jgi:hypothetical protein